MTACYHGWKPKKKKGKKKIKCPQKKVAKKFMKAKESVLPKFDEVYLRMLHEAEKCKNKNIYHS
jgi:glutaredoxin